MDVPGAGMYTVDGSCLHYSVKADWKTAKYVIAGSKMSGLIEDSGICVGIILDPILGLPLFPGKY